jgi:His/Glu/Gln/Arg/opine family amino acid ABC transporter permease subunit
MIELIRSDGWAILAGLMTTIRIVGIGFLLGAMGGVLIGLLRDGGPVVVRVLAGAFVEVIRNTPFLIQAALLFAVVGVLRLRLPPELIGTVSVALYTSAYMAEIVRGALRSVPAGQREAADALGLRPGVRFRKVIFPQLLPFAVPASANLLATVTKESAFLSAVAVAELTYAGQVVIARTFKVFEVWAIVGILYLVLILALLALAERLEGSFRWAHAHRS